MWGEHVIDFSVAEVEVTELQRCNLVLVCSNCTDPLREVRSDQGVLKISGHAVSIYCRSEVVCRWVI
jgi:hypothetical protein